MLEEFRKFIQRGNVFELATGVVLGVAFGNIVSSLVDDIIMPPIGMLLGKVDFSNFFINLSGTPYRTLAEAQAAGAPTINYGLFLNAIVNFLIISFVIFMFVRQIDRLKRKETETEPTTKECPYCISTIPLKATRCSHCTSELL